jgi:predicted secreted Zn-dependent protease
MAAVRAYGAALFITLSACSGARLDPATRATLSHSVPPDVPALEISRSEASYAVAGASAADLRHSIKDHARASWPDPDAAGMTNVQIAAEVRCQEYADGGALSQAKLKLIMVVHLPNWEARAQAPQALRAAWDSFSAALRVHEEGHVAIATRHAAALRHQFEAMKPTAACPDLMDEATALVRATDAAMMKEQLDYDAKTNHGGTQGCVL